MSLLVADGLSVEYREVGAVTKALNEASIEIEAGSVVGIVGETGSGKSTLALALLGLTRLGGTITGGSVRFEGRELLALSERQWQAMRGAQIGFIPQNPRGALNPVQRIGEQIISHYRAHTGASREDAQKRAIELLALVGINDPERRLHAFPHELSGGMAQRVLISLALACSPKLVIADEPTSGLDVTIQDQVLHDMRSSVQAVGSGLLLITQDLGVVAHYCDRVSFLYAGEIVEEATVDRFFNDPRHPASIALLAAQGIRHDHKRVRLRGLPADLRRLPVGCYLASRCAFASSEAGCDTLRPELRKIDDGHRVRCFRQDEVPNLAREIASNEIGALANG